MTQPAAPTPPPLPRTVRAADQEIRAAALLAATTLLGPAIGALAHAFAAENLDQTGGGALRLAARFEAWIRDGGST